jgi:Phasin protein
MEATQMAETVKTIEDWENPALAVLAAYAKVQKSGFTPMAWLAPQMLEKCSEMGSELAGFVAARIKEDVNLQHQLLHCKDISKLHHIQINFVQTAINQYVAETGKLTQLGTEMLNGVVHPEST